MSEASSSAVTSTHAGERLGRPWTRHLGSAAVTGLLTRTAVLKAVHGVEEVDSTQDVALDLARGSAASGTVVVTDRQLRGRGRRGRRWDDIPHGGSLALTLLLDAPAHSLTLVPLAVGLAVADACERLVGTQRGHVGRIGLKWPNDVVVRSVSGSETATLRKLSGILVQRERVASRDVLLVGVGLNVDRRASPPAPDRICLAAFEPSLPGRASILVTLLGALDTRLEQLLGDHDRGPEAVLDAYRAASDTLGRHVDIELPDGRGFTGVVRDVDSSGALCVEVDGRIEVIVAGTVRDHVVVMQKGAL